MFVFEGYIVHEWVRTGQRVQEEDAAGMFCIQPLKSRCQSFGKAWGAFLRYPFSAWETLRSPSPETMNEIYSYTLSNTPTEKQTKKEK